jgi:SseB protein C-terminal domain
MLPGARIASLLFMPMPFDWNELDKAIFALGRSKSALPDVYRALPKGKLCAVMPYHPEMEGMDFKIENGMECPFIMFEEKEGTAVALFSSEARAEEGMMKGGVPENTFVVGAMPAKQMLEVVGKMNLHASLNKGCATGTFFFGPDLMLDLVNGKALEPPGTGPTEEHTVDLIDPAGYPTDIIQPLFETLRRHRAFRAAWVTRRKEPTPEGGAHYQFLLLVQPRDQNATHDFNIVLQTVRQQPDDVSFGRVDEEDEEYVRYLLDRAIPFYTAPDFKGARSLVELE